MTLHTQGRGGRKNTRGRGGMTRKKRDSQREGEGGDMREGKGRSVTEGKEEGIGWQVTQGMKAQDHPFTYRKSG